MIPKRITKWPIEITNDNLPLNFNEITHPLPVIDLSISHLKSKTPPKIEVGIYVTCPIYKGGYNENPNRKYNPDKLFEFSTLSKFSFDDPGLEDASFQFIYTCMVTAVKEFNNEVSKNPSVLLNFPDNPKEKIQQPILTFENAREAISRIWGLHHQAN